MATTLADYETALETCVTSPTPTNAARAANAHAALPQVVKSGDDSIMRPDLPQWVADLAARLATEGTGSASLEPRILNVRTAYGDGR